MAAAVTEVAVGLPALTRALSDGGHRRVLLLTGPSRRHLDLVLPALGGAVVHAVFDGARVHVPAETVAEAERLAGDFAPDALLCVGGGAATGLGKLLRLSHAIAFFVAPTTFSGSEMTAIWGRTEGGEKRTGRDPRARPDLVIHDPALVADMPQRLALQSALNALAHPLSALSTSALSEAQAALALEAAARVWSPLGQLVGEPDSTDARFMLLRGAALCGRVIDDAPLGLHHRIAHLLGGSFALPHGAVHSVLLPYTVGLLRRDAGTFATLTDALGHPDPGPALHGLLRATGCPADLGALGVDAAGLADCQQALAALDPAAPGIAEAALSGATPG